MRPEEWQLLVRIAGNKIDDGNQGHYLAVNTDFADDAQATNL